MAAIQYSTTLAVANHAATTVQLTLCFVLTA